MSLKLFLMPKSSSPNVTFFQDFQKKWPHLDKRKFSCADKDTMTKIDSDNIIKFCEKQLLENQPRDDYRELLQLSILFVDGNLNTPVSFRMPGPIHHARWMAKAIYSLEIYDTAERGVKLIEEYNIKLTKDEQQKQIIIQVVKDYRTMYPDSKKRILMKAYTYT